MCIQKTFLTLTLSNIMTKLEKNNIPFVMDYYTQGSIFIYNGSRKIEVTFKKKTIKDYLIDDYEQTHEISKNTLIVYNNETYLKNYSACDLDNIAINEIVNFLSDGAL